MVESLITISLVGLLAGFIFSMPIAGPISILITSNALNGRVNYCNKVAIGASLADFIYVFISVYGITKLYPHLKSAMPYILGAGAIFIFFVGIRIYKSHVDLEHAGEIHPKTGKLIPKGTGGLYTGFMINFLNPTLLFGSFATTVLVISFVSSLGFDTGGLNLMMDQNVKTMSSMEGHQNIQHNDAPSYFKADTLKFLKNHASEVSPVKPSWFPLVISFAYALFLATGSVIWFMLMTLIIKRFRRKINLKVINGIIHVLGIFLCLFGVFFAYTAVKMLF